MLMHHGDARARSFQAFMTDHAEELARLTRLYAALSQINQAIVRAHAREPLFQRVCAALVEHGGFRMAWLGWHDAATKRLMPVAQAGDHDGYLQSIEVYVDERPEGRGPSGVSFRENRPYVCNALLTDGIAAPWRAAMERRGLRASAVFPVHVQGVAAGTLSVYADQEGFFRDREIALLAEAAADVSFALDNLAREAAHREAQKTVEHLAALVASTDDAIVSKTLDGIVTSWNPAAERMFGYRADEIVGRSIEVLIPPDRPGEEAMVLARIRRGERIMQLETVRQRKDGTRLSVSITVSPIWASNEGEGAAPRIVGVSKIARDVSERNRTQALVESEQRLIGGLVEAMPGVFYLYDERGRFLRWNRNFERVTGRSAAEIALMTPLDFFAPGEKEILAARIADVFESGEAAVEASLVAKDGTSTPYFLTGKRLVLEGAPCLVGVGVDITARRVAEDAVKASEERFRSTLDGMLEGCQLLDFDWCYLYVNAAAAAHSRRSIAELVGRRMPDVWPGIEATAVFALLRRCLEERAAGHDEIEFTFPDGSSAWFDVHAQPVPEGVFVLSMEVTERHHAARALVELNLSLEAKVAERTVALEAARERAESADRLKSSFLATMSHELRTPLNSILGFTGIVLQGMAGPMTAEQTKQLGMVQGSARHLLDLINDVLDISKIEAGQLEMRRAPFDLRKTIERVAASVAPLAAKKAIMLALELPAELPTMESDQRRVAQILLNLVNNALKFTDRGQVTVACEVIGAWDQSLGHGSAVRLRVSDTGIGIRDEDLGRLFQPFLQLDSGLQRQHEGTGLGLAICRRLTGLLGGTIGAESAPGRGSVFTVTLPLRAGDS